VSLPISGTNDFAGFAIIWLNVQYLFTCEICLIAEREDEKKLLQTIRKRGENLKTI
jgi:hypothetical protein